MCEQIPKGYGDCVFEMDGWHVVSSKNGGYWFLHRCVANMPCLVAFYAKDSKARMTGKEGSWTPNWSPSWRCCSCWQQPPEGIIAVYAMLNYDQVGDEMAAGLGGE